MEFDNRFSTLDVLFNHSKEIGLCTAGRILSVKMSVAALAKQGLREPSVLLSYIGSGQPNSERNRRGLIEKMMANSPAPCPLIGKPSSAFILRDKKGFVYIDYLIEDPSFKRDPRRTLHSYMVDFDNLEHSDRYHPTNLHTRNSLWSGHLANLSPELCDGDYCYVYLFDKFERKSTSIESKDEFIINILHVNSIFPLTADGNGIPKR